MKLLLVNDSPLDIVGSHYYAVDPWIRLPVQLADHCEKMTLWASVVRPGSKMAREGSWKVDLGKMEIAAHSPFHSFVKFYRMYPFHWFSWRRQAAQLVAAHDAVIIRLPSPMLPLVARMALKRGKPLVLFIAGDIERQSDRILGSKGIKRSIYKLLVRYWVAREKKFAKRSSLVYVYNKELQKRYTTAKVRNRLIRTPHIGKNDFSYRSDTCGRLPIKILRVSWLIPSKGIEFLIEAVSLLFKNNIDAVLEIVGKEREAGYRETLEALANDLGVKARVKFPGWIPFDRIKEVYMRNDIQIVSSLAEGTPRVIIEGAANGLPLICTNVGGNMESLISGENALIVPPADSNAIAGAVMHIIRDVHLRQKLIKNGYALARQFSFDVLGVAIADEIAASVG